MKHGNGIVAWGLESALVAGCGGEEPAPEEATEGERVMAVPDSTIEREIATRLDADPRLDAEGIRLGASSQDGIVYLTGEVPSRMEMSIAREVAMSAPGVVDVSLDSLIVRSEIENDAATPDSAAME